jgi:hypothetical protein
MLDLLEIDALCQSRRNRRKSLVLMRTCKGPWLGNRVGELRFKSEMLKY